jgi:hypothetical protein
VALKTGFHDVSREPVRPGGRLMKSATILLSIVCLFLCVTTAGAATPTDVSIPISIELKSTGAQVVAGEGLEVIAAIKNESKSNVYLGEWDMRLILPLPLEGLAGGVNGRPAFFPTEPHQIEDADNPDKYFRNNILLKPGDTYNAFWTEAPSGKSKIEYVYAQITTQLQYLLFVPAKYDFVVITRYRTDSPTSAYRTLSTTVTLPVSAPLFVILVGAALGGIIGYVIFPKQRQQDSRNVPFFGPLVRVMGAALLSVIVTILISRISETQFPIKVTVNDFWGSIAIGFVAYYSGIKLLEKILPSDRGKERKDTEDKSQNKGAEGEADKKP